jgi:pimeloyl-ACP methyl ester carboxylesterase
MGSGPPLLKTANWLNHLEFDFQSPLWQHWLRELSREHRLIRYDERGNGLSDRDVDDLSFDRFVDDLESVVQANGLTRYPLFGISQGCPVAVAHAVRHPERVSHLVLVNGFVQGYVPRKRPRETANAEALLTLASHGWGKSHPAFRQVFTSLYFPDATADQMRDFNELQRKTATPEQAVRLMRAIGAIDVSALLSQVTIPTLVLHARHDGLVPFEEGRALATGIPGARFVPLESRNHLFAEDEPAFARMLEEMRSFLAR